MPFIQCCTGNFWAILNTLSFRPKHFFLWDNSWVKFRGSVFFWVKGLKRLLRKLPRVTHKRVCQLTSHPKRFNLRGINPPPSHLKKKMLLNCLSLSAPRSHNRGGFGFRNRSPKSQIASDSIAPLNLNAALFSLVSMKMMMMMMMVMMMIMMMIDPHGSLSSKFRG